MAVEVVGREVEEDRALGREGDRCPRAGSWSTRRPRSRPGSTSPASEESGVPTLPATATGSPARAVEVTEQLDRGRLAVGPGDRDEAVRDRPPGQLELADHRRSPARSAAAITGASRGTPGLLTTVRVPSSSANSIRIQDDFDAGPRKPCRPSGWPESTPHRLPRAASSRAAACPSEPARRPETALGQRRARLPGGGEHPHSLSQSMARPDRADRGLLLRREPTRGSGLRA